MEIWSHQSSSSTYIYIYISWEDNDMSLSSDTFVESEKANPKQSKQGEITEQKNRQGQRQESIYIMRRQ